MTQPRNKTRWYSLILILGVCALPLTATAGFDWNIGHRGAVNDFFEIEAFHTTVTNNNATTDTVMVNMVKNMSTNWVASLCEDLLCYPPFLLDIELILEPGQTKELIIDITPIVDAGSGATDITLVSKSNPADTAAATFTVLTPGADVLYVSSTGDSGTDALFTNALTTAGATSATWDLTVMGKAGQADLSQFATVVWGAGTSEATLSSTDRDSLAAYVAAGGDLFLSGSNLAYSYCDAGSPNFDAAACTWFQSTFGLNYVANTGGTNFVTGGPSDPVFANAAYGINGGDGSNNNASPDVIAPSGGGLASLTYNDGGTAVVANNPAGGRTLYAGFGFEGIATAASRADFMSQTLAWFAGGVSAVGDDLPPVFASGPAAAPNPFNPQTNIKFAVGGQRSVPVVVTVYDVQGRAVRHLFQGTVAPGLQNLTWNGRDDKDHSMAAGLYMARVQVDQAAQVVKMTLAK